MLTFQADDGSRVVMVLGGRGEHGISTHPRIAIRRFVAAPGGSRRAGRRGLFPTGLVAELRGDGAVRVHDARSAAHRAPARPRCSPSCSARCRRCERIITVEKNLLELRLEDDPRHPDAPALFTRHSNAEGEGEITTRQLVELTRRLNPDRVVVGELVEDEALDMLDVASMCKRGSLATIHAHTVRRGRAATRVLRLEVEHEPAGVRGVEPDRADGRLRHPHRSRPQRGAGRRRRSARHVDHRDRRPRRRWRVCDHRGVGDRGVDGELVQVAPLSPRHLDRLRLSGYDPHLFAADGSG